MAVFISLEGLSGVGKTETAKRLAHSIAGEFVQLTAAFTEAKDAMTRVEDVNARMCVFVAAMLYSSVRISERLARGVSVVVDGYLARTIAYHRGMGATVQVDATESILSPDYSIMLTCNEEERLRRVVNRNRVRQSGTRLSWRISNKSGLFIKTISFR